MILTILSIPFGSAFIYNLAARQIAKRCFRRLTKEEIERYGEASDEARVFDNKKAGRYLAVMAVCYYPAYPLLIIQRWLTD